MSIPSELLYVPGVHAEQGASPPLPVYPTLHMQSVISSLPMADIEFERQTWHTSETAPTAVEYFPARQSVQATLPLVILYFPGTQPVHVPPLRPENPALHRQSFRASLATGALEFVGQLSQVLAAVAVEYVPARQSVQATLPLMSLYFPATQPVHVPPSSLK